MKDPGKNDQRDQWGRRKTKRQAFPKFISSFLREIWNRDKEQQKSWIYWPARCSGGITTERDMISQVEPPLFQPWESSASAQEKAAGDVILHGRITRSKTVFSSFCSIWSFSKNTSPCFQRFITLRKIYVFFLPMMNCTAVCLFLAGGWGGSLQSTQLIGHHHWKGHKKPDWITSISASFWRESIKRHCK